MSVCYGAGSYPQGYPANNGKLRFAAAVARPLW